jgi:hypothetical protein
MSVSTAARRTTGLISSNDESTIGSPAPGYLATPWSTASSAASDVFTRPTAPGANLGRNVFSATEMSDSICRRKREPPALRDRAVFPESLHVQIERLDIEL